MHIMIQEINYAEDRTTTQKMAKEIRERHLQTMKQKFMNKQGGGMKMKTKRASTVLSLSPMLPPTMMRRRTNRKNRGSYYHMPNVPRV